MLAQAAVYKCVGNDGAVSYSAVPCPATEGQTTRIVEPMPTSGPPAAVPPWKHKPPPQPRQASQTAHLARASP
ncbi:DUF4124 domain-containing protein [Metapseudomonas otitidis]